MYRRVIWFAFYFLASDVAVWLLYALYLALTGKL